MILGNENVLHLFILLMWILSHRTSRGQVFIPKNESIGSFATLALVQNAVVYAGYSTNSLL
jgi:hypothetical protein